MKEIQFNINDDVKVQLTKDGLVQLKKWYADLNIIKYYKIEDADIDGYSTFQFWDLMNKFGDEM